MIAKLIGWLGANSHLCILVCVGLIGAFVGGGITKAYYKLQLATVQRDIATERQAAADRQAEAADAALARLIRAERRGDELTIQLSQANEVRAQLAKEKDHANTTLTTGRACLGAGVVGVLNSGDSGTGVSGQLSEATRLAFAADSAAAADTAYASDTDIALWARNARDEHDACRERIAALRNWYAD